MDRILERRLAEALREDTVQHVSVFGFARLPLLVYFGSRLDDTFAVTIYQRHRSTEAWNWPDNPAPSTSFTTTSPQTPRRTPRRESWYSTSPAQSRLTNFPRISRNYHAG
ncbi:SAVED domain-containing protein [Streptomyces sp. UC1A3]